MILTEKIDYNTCVYITQSAFMLGSFLSWHVKCRKPLMLSYACSHSQQKQPLMYLFIDDHQQKHVTD